MPSVLCCEIVRRNPFKLEALPWIAKVYRYPFDRYGSIGTQALFGAPNYLLFLFFQKFWPLKLAGAFKYQIQGREQIVEFNARNTQFHALYFKQFDMGYEPQITALINLLLPSDGVFYDIGSNWGWFSFQAASRPDFRGQVHAFEPFKSTYNDLSSLIQQTNLGTVIHAHNVALSDSVGSGSMRLPDHFQSGRAVLEAEPAGSANATAMATLDSLKLPPPTIIKADVEGHELRVFKGGTRLFSEHKPMLVFEHSRHDNNPGESLQSLIFLHDLGYEFFHVGWLRTEQGRKYLVGDDADPTPQSKETLALAPFRWEERFLKPQGMNIFVCHRDKVPALKILFKECELG